MMYDPDELTMDTMVRQDLLMVRQDCPLVWQDCLLNRIAHW